MMNSRDFEDKITAMRNIDCAKCSSDCILKDICPTLSLSEKEDVLKKIKDGVIVVSKGELVEKDDKDEVFVITVDENTGKAKVEPDIYEGDEILQSTIFSDIQEVYLNSNGDAVNSTDDYEHVMMKFPKIHYEIEKDEVNKIITITVSRKPIGRCLAHTYEDEEYNFVYIGKYLLSKGYKTVSGVQPMVNISFDDVKKEIKDSPFKMIRLHQITLLQILYLLRVRELDSQTHLGKGVTNSQSLVDTGGTNDKGLFYGCDDATKSVSVAGIEDFYGNCFYYVDGLRTSSTEIIVDEQYKLPFKSMSGWLTSCVGNTEFGFTPNGVK